MRQRSKNVFKIELTYHSGGHKTGNHGIQIKSNYIFSVGSKMHIHVRKFKIESDTLVCSYVYILTAGTEN